jgi:hypothetical protein
VDTWDGGGTPPTDGGGPRRQLEEAVSDEAAGIARQVEGIAVDAGRALAECARHMGLEYEPHAHELSGVLREMPRFDVGTLDLQVRRPALVALGRRWSVHAVARRLTSRAGSQIAEAIATYARLLRSWVQDTFVELQGRFDSYAEVYRAQLDRLSGSGAPDPGNELDLRKDLSDLSGTKVHRGTRSHLAPTRTGEPCLGPRSPTDS